MIPIKLMLYFILFSSYRVKVYNNSDLKGYPILRESFNIRNTKKTKIFREVKERNEIK